MATGRFHWSNCAPEAVFVKINYSAALPWFGLALHPSWLLVKFAAALTVGLIYLQFVKKMTVTDFLRSLCVFLVGRVKNPKF